jgi:hypothetical protein
MGMLSLPAQILPQANKFATNWPGKFAAIHFFVTRRRNHANTIGIRPD